MPHRSESCYAQVLAPTQQQQLDQLADSLDLVKTGDRMFFERWKNRRHRIRLASPAEIEEQRIVTGRTSVPAEHRLFVAIRALAPDQRVRAFFPGPEDCETDLAEELCEVLFQFALCGGRYE